MSVTGDASTRGAFLSWGSPPQFAYWDCIVKERVSNKSDVTDHPVEAGIAITDNVRPLPRKISLQGYISQAPIRTVNVEMDLETEALDIKQPPPPLFTILGAITSPPTGPSVVAARVLEASGYTNTVTQMDDLLTALQTGGVFVTVNTSSKVYSNMIVEGFDKSGDSGTGTGRMFDVSLKEMRIVQSLSTAAPVPANPSVNVKTTVGAQATTPAKDQSLAKKLKGYIA